MMTPQELGRYLMGQPPVTEEERAFMRNLQHNSGYLKPGANNFATTLDPAKEAAFRQWVAANNIPFDPNATGPSDYDMRGFYLGLQSGDPHASTGLNSNDGQMHYSDYWKTPYHQSFSSESQWAAPNAPMWNAQDQLVEPGGAVVFDERARPFQDAGTPSLAEILARSGVTF